MLFAKTQDVEICFDDRMQSYFHINMIHSNHRYLQVMLVEYEVGKPPNTFLKMVELKIQNVSIQLIHSYSVLLNRT